MATRILVLVTLLSGIAGAETLKLHDAYAWPREFTGQSALPCEDDTVAALDKLSQRGMLLRIEPDKMLVAPYGKAKISLSGEHRTGVWNLGARSLVIRVGPTRWSKALKCNIRSVVVTLVVEVDVEKRDKVKCYEQWRLEVPV